MTDAENNHSYRILIIDDNQAIHQDFAKILIRESNEESDLDDLEAVLFGTEKAKSEASDFRLDCATQGLEGVAMVEQALADGQPYTLAFVDSRMPPGIDGVETIQRLWQKDPELQVVFCTAYADYSWQEIRDILGETDNLLVLKKPFDNMEVLQMVHALTRKWQLAKDAKGRLHQLAFYDRLTGLPNRTMLSERLASALKHAKANQSQVALLFIDVDNFKRFNDSLGHGFGDKLLKIIAEKIVSCLRASDIVGRWVAARLGGDEFIVVLPNITSERVCAGVAQRITDTVVEPFMLGGHQIQASLSIGIAICPQDGETSEDLLKNADMAMYTAKRTGKNTIAYYQESMNTRAVKRLAVENALRNAPARNEFFLHYQPQMELESGKISGLEALLRWHNPTLGQVSPFDFIPIAEELGLIIEVGAWVLRAACAQARMWIDQGLFLPRIAVNVSIKQFCHPDFVSDVKQILADTGLDPEVLEIEITETLFEDNVVDLGVVVQQLRRIGVSIAIDDFGTGYAGLSRFRNIQVDFLKIDRSFIREIETSSSARDLIRGILALSKCLNLNVISEGIETPAQIKYLRSIGCQYIQGYLYSKPLTAEATESFLRNPPDTPPPPPRPAWKPRKIVCSDFYKQ
ncbi:MAG: GGDEF domain-containing response regulator [Proteobacteria bacterium]|nr:MAG: GGDEF domain-containing response regulator [Pseudomonadota bacterium]